MKKLALVLAVVMVTASVGSVFASSVGLFGGFSYVAFGFHYFPQPGLSEALSKAGYGNFPDYGMGLTVGGGGVVNNFFIGGWGMWSFNQDHTANESAGKTLSKSPGGRGGFEVGYVVLDKKHFSLIPSFTLVWGGSGVTFSTNMSVAEYLENPVEFSPGFGFSEFSLGIGLNSLVKFNSVGFIVKAVYLYTPTMQWDVGFSNTPELNKHSVNVSIGTYFGNFGHIDNYKRDYDIVPEYTEEDINPSTL
jgi:hypothetical protein